MFSILILQGVALCYSKPKVLDTGAMQQSWLRDHYAHEQFPSSVSDKPWGRNGKRKECSTPNSWGVLGGIHPRVQDVHLLTRAFQIQHFSSQGTLLPLTFFTRLTKIWLPIYLLERKVSCFAELFAEMSRSDSFVFRPRNFFLNSRNCCLGFTVLLCGEPSSLFLCCIQKVAQFTDAVKSVGVIQPDDVPVKSPVWHQRGLILS